MSTKVRILLGDPETQRIFTGAKAYRILERADPILYPEDAGIPRWQRAINVYRRLCPQVRIEIFRTNSKQKSKVFLQTLEQWGNHGIPRLRRSVKTEIELRLEREQRSGRLRFT